MMKVTDGMFRVIFMQVLIIIITAVAAGLFVGVRGLVSAVIGGGVYILPNLLFAWRLRSITHRQGSSYTINFFLGELVKIILVFVLLAIVIKIYADLHWPSMLIGLALASQAMFLAFWKKK
jgi:ATP synthase protein I